MIINFLKKNFPYFYKFIRNFFKALNNTPEGHSLRKWLSVGFFWLISILVLRYTDNNNLVSIVTVLCGMITTLIVTYSISNYKEKQLNSQSSKEETSEQS